MRPKQRLKSILSRIIPIQEISVYFLFGFFSIFLFHSCTKIVEIVLPDHEAKLVINSMFSGDSRMKVHLSKTVPILEDSIPLVVNALIELYEDSVLSDTLLFSGGHYYSSENPAVGKRYSIKVSVPEMDVAYAEDIIPFKTIIQSYSHLDSIMIDDNNFPIMQLGVTFLDNPGENFYELSIIAEYISGGTTMKHPVWFKNTTDIVLNETGLLDYNPQTLVFNDDLFDGDAVTIKVNYTIQTGEIPLIGDGPEYGYKLHLSLRSISESFYQYRRKQIIYLYQLESSIFTGMQDPVLVYSNVNGGYGIFAGYSTDNKSINIIVN